MAVQSHLAIPWGHQALASPYTWPTHWRNSSSVVALPPSVLAAAKAAPF
jgi:hypothetical protein